MIDKCEWEYRNTGIYDQECLLLEDLIDKNINELNKAPQRVIDAHAVKHHYGHGPGSSKLDGFGVRKNTNINILNDDSEHKIHSDPVVEYQERKRGNRAGRKPLSKDKQTEYAMIVEYYEKQSDGDKMANTVSQFNTTEREVNKALTYIRKNKIRKAR